MKKEGFKKLIKGEETESIEFKSSLSEWKKVVETLAAFAWTTGGKIIFGISKSGKIIGVDVGKGTIEKLANDIKLNTDPRLYPRISVEKLENKNVIIIEIEKVSDEPVLAFGKAFKRVGKSTHTLSSEEYKRLIREERKVYFDSLVCDNASLKDIDWNFVRSFFIPKYETITETKVAGTPEELFEALGCIKNRKPTNAGILLFGKNPQKFFINAYIALARYRGKEVGAERLDYKEFEGNLFQQIDNCDRYIKEHIAVMSRLHPFKVEREDIPEYPLFSIRELITNAVCHRDNSDQRSKVIIKIFDNSIEFYNPGGLPEEITPENILDKQFSRNPIIAKVLAKIRYIEELGEGWNKIIDEHKEHPLKPKIPEIKADKYTFIVRLFSTKEKFVEEIPPEIIKLDKRKRMELALRYVREKGSITNKEYREITHVSKRTASSELSQLVKVGILMGVGKYGRGMKYMLKKLGKKLGKK